jgi:hypothetical protein
MPCLNLSNDSTTFCGVFFGINAILFTPKTIVWRCRSLEVKDRDGLVEHVKPTLNTLLDILFLQSLGPLEITTL